MIGKIKSDEGIISPVRGKHEPEVGQDLLMVMIPSELAYLAGKTGAEAVPLKALAFSRLYQSRIKGQRTLAMTGPFLGAPQAVMALEKLIALGARRIWVLGWCGSLQPHLRVGDLLIPTEAVSEEGTSAHYPIVQPKPRPDPELKGIIEKTLTRQGLPYKKGSIWTTDAVYRETPAKVRKYQSGGIMAVEMELSALMTVAAYRSVAMAGLLVVSDELFELKWRPGFTEPVMKDNTRRAADALLRAALF